MLRLRNVTGGPLHSCMFRKKELAESSCRSRCAYLDRDRFRRMCWSAAWSCVPASGEAKPRRVSSRVGRCASQLFEPQVGVHSAFDMGVPRKDCHVSLCAAKKSYIASLVPRYAPTLG